MFRPAFRSVFRQSGPAQRRTIANEASLNAGAETEFMKSRKAVADHAGHSAELWRKLTYVYYSLTRHSEGRGRRKMKAKPLNKESH